ncbi:MAG: NAD(+)/NADH kinase [Chloroflexota bacterium]|nr:NAD(+)/NADH kinase [Chloroflexota bacterium]
MTYDGKAIGIVFNQRVKQAVELASALVERLGARSQTWSCPAVDVDAHAGEARSTGLIITVGGDGTILRAVRLAAPHGIPLLGINLGRLGFMTELKAEEALARVPEFLDGAGRVEERTMLQAEVLTERMRQEPLREERPGRLLFHALNDVVVGRGAVSRLVHIRAKVDGVDLAAYRADAVIVSTATGSTGYNLAAGGPILQPQSPNILLNPVAPHLGIGTALVFLPDTVIELVAESEGQCTVSIDGYVDMALSPQDSVRVTRSPYVARFLRLNPQSHYYATLIQRLGLVWGLEGYRTSY